MKLFTITTSLLVLSFAMMSQAANVSSIEFMCKSKAKEIAAETYRGCVTENKQANIERIRKEYQAKLAELKSTYNSELKKLSSKGSSKPSESSNTSLGINSGNDMPAKKMSNSKVKIEKIDFSSSAKSELVTETMPVGSNSDDSTDQSLTATEIVEIPVQQE